MGSILLAFALDAWWEERTEQARTEELLAAVGAEFELEAAELDSIVAANERAFEQLPRVMARTDPARSLPPVPDDSIPILASAILETQIYDPGFGALTALISSGGLEEIDDPELRRVLGGWQAELLDLEWERELIRAGNHRFAERFEQLGAMVQAYRRLGGEGWLPTYVRALQTDPLLRNIHFGTMGNMRVYTDELIRVRDRAGEVATTIRARQAGG